MKWTKAIAGLMVVAVVGLFGVRIAAYRSKAAEPKRTEAPAPVVAIAKPSRRTLVDRVRFSGVVRPRNEVDVSAKVGGRIQDLKVEVGDVVKAGTQLLVVEHTELGLQSDQARAQFEAAEAQVAAARIQLASAETQQKRVTQLEVGGAVAQADREKAELGLKGAEAQLKAAEAQARLAQAAANLAGRAVQNSFVTAPFGGTITRRMVSLGAQVGPGQPLLQLQDLAELKLAAQVTAGDFSRLVLGQPVEIRVEELPDVTISGRIATLSPSLDPVTRRAQIEMAIDNSGGRLLANMFAHAEVVVGERKHALVVPADAVVVLPAGPVVFVAEGGRVRSVNLGAVHGDDAWTIVDGRVSPEASVVVRGQAGLLDGQAIRTSEGAP